jgi:hypothetical protein
MWCGCMAKRRTGFPSALSVPVKWTGPPLQEVVMAEMEVRNPNLALKIRSESFDESTEQAMLAQFDAIDAVYDFKLAKAQALHEIEVKELILANHYGIVPCDSDDPDFYRRLVVALTDDFFPGFRIDYGDGPRKKRKWGLSENFQLIADVDSIVKERQCSDRQAISIYLQRKNVLRPSDKSIKSMESRLSKARRDCESFNSTSDHPVRKTIFARVLKKAILDSEK